MQRCRAGGNGQLSTVFFFIAECALQAGSPAAWPHLLAALSIATIETRNIADKSGIRSPCVAALVPRPVCISLYSC